MSVRAKSFLLLFILSVVWGTSFILIKKGLDTYSAGQVGALRISIAGLLFLPVFIKNVRYLDNSKIKVLLLFGFCEIGLPPFLFAFAETGISSSTTGILNSLVPLFTLGIGFILFRVKVNSMKVAGVLIGLLGAFLLTFFRFDNGFSSFGRFDLANIYAFSVILAGIFYGLAGNILKEHLADVSDIAITSSVFVFMSVPALLYLATTDFVNIPLTEPDNLFSFVSIFILSTVNSALAIYLFSILTKISTALFASFVTYLIPFVAIFWGFLDGEAISIYHFIGLGIILGGIYIANMAMRKENAPDKYAEPVVIPERINE